MQYGLSASLKNLYDFVKESYTYDKNGNRKTKTTPYGTIEYNYDNENCLLSSGSKGMAFVNYTYDKMGNLLTEESAGKTIKYAYNAQNRLIYCEVTDKTEETYAQTTYAYDAFGRRIIVQDKGEVALRSLYDGFTFDVIKQSQTNASGLFTDTNITGIRWGKTGKPTGDRYRYISDDEANDNSRYFNISKGSYKTVTSRYRGERTQITVNGILAAQTTSDYGTEYFSTDLLGSIRTTSDSFGTAKSTVSYDAFGSIIEGSLTNTADFGYLGKQHDSTSSLYNYGYRDYKSQYARFTTVDPIRDGANWFAYCNGDPVNFVDFFGLEAGDVRPIQPYNQKSKELADIEELEKSGCYFMSCLFIAQDYSNKNLTANEIKQIVNECKADEIINDEFIVSNPDKITNIAFKTLGVDRTATYGWGAEELEGQTQVPDYYIESGTTVLNNPHYKVKDEYDPAQTGDGITAPVNGSVFDDSKTINLVPVYIH